MTSDQGTNDDLPTALHKGKRQCTYHISFFVSYNNFSSSTYIKSEFVHKVVHEVLTHTSWHAAMVKEMSVLDDNCTWDSILAYWLVVNQYSRSKSIQINLYSVKSSLVAKDDTQTYGGTILVLFL